MVKPALQSAAFVERLPRRPYCTDDPAQGLLIRPQATALAYRHIQHNPPPHVSTLVFDVDRADGYHAWRDAGLPAPHWVCVNLRNGQYVMIAGGDQGASGIPDADRGVWQVTANQGAAFADFTKVLDGYNTAAEIGIVDTANFFAATNVESALALRRRREEELTAGAAKVAAVRALLDRA